MEMYFSQTSEYALRAIVFLADSGGAPQTVAQIAAATRVSPGYLSKVMRALVLAGYVNGQRGLGGGFTLAKSSDDISVLDIVDAVDPIRRINSCPLGLKTHGSNLCSLHRKLDDALASVQQAFSSSSIADILSTPGKSHPLCDVTRDGKRIRTKQQDPPAGTRSAGRSGAK